MSDCVILTRYWEEYPLETTVAVVSSRFDVGPFQGQAASKADGTAEAAVLLRLTDEERGEPVTVTPGGSAWVSRGSLSYRLERASLAPRIRRRLRPEVGVLLGGAFAVLFVASIFSWSAMSPPALHELAEDAPRAPAPTTAMVPYLQAVGSDATPERRAVGPLHDVAR